MICIVIPVYNVELYLKRCLDSILTQSYKEYRILLIDDGSTDSSAEICDYYVELDKRVEVFHQQNAGVSVARNRGIEIALNRGYEWLTFIDSDDWVSEDYLQGLLDAANQTGSKISFGSYLYTDSTECTLIKDSRPIGVETPTEMYLNKVDTLLVQAPWSKLFASELFYNRDYRFPVGIRYEDSATIYKILFSQKKIAYNYRSVYFYYQNPNGFMGSGWKPERMKFIDVMLEQADWLNAHGFSEAAGEAADTLALNLSEGIESLSNDGIQGQCKQKMRKTVAFLLKKYKKQARFTVKKNYWYFDVAYPRTMWWYWTVKAQLRKIHIVGWFGGEKK